MPSIPDLPGTPVPRNSDQERWLKDFVARLCQLDSPKFPGSQPVSFGTKDLAKLEKQDYWVCEKSDGVRVLLLVLTDPGGNQSTYIIDRHNTYRELTGFFFPHHEDLSKSLRSSLIDGELVIDVDPQTKQEKLRYLAFDCLVVDDQNVMSKTLDKRYGRLQQWFYKPYAQMLIDHPRMASSQPFEIRVKDISFSYHVEKVFNVDIPSLKHGSDGLIYTCVHTPYTPGTDTNILKWKPPSENSIDFKLVLRFPPLPSNQDKPDFCAKPVFLLFVWCGDEKGVPKYEQYDELYVEDAEWERLKLSREQVDDRIVEVHWDPVGQHWRMMRFRDDKPNANHVSVVQNIIQSIADGVEKDALLARSNAIRNAWKARLGQPPPPQPQPQLQSSVGYPPMPPPSHAQAHYPQPPPPRSFGPPPPTTRTHQPPLDVEIRYGPLAPSPWSKVGGPPIVAGMKR